MAKLFEITGKAISGEWGNDDENGSGIPVLRTTNFTNTGIINYSKVVTRIIKKKNIAEKFLRKGDIIIEKSGGSDKQPVGRVVYFDAEENKYLFNNFTSLLRIIDSNICFSKYLFYILFFYYHNGNTIPFENKTTGLHNLKIDDYVKSCEIPLPPIEVQHQIAENLDKVTRTINICNAILEKLDLLVKARFVEMFGDPSSNPYCFDSVPFNDCIEYIGDIGSNGANKVVVEHLDMKDSKDYALMVRFLNFTKNDFNNDVKYISKDSYNFFKKSQLFGGELIMCKIGSAGQNYVMPYLNRPVSLGLNQIMIRIRDNILMSYLYQYLHTSYGEMLIDSCINGAVTKSITKTELKKIPILIPPLEQQTKFANFVERIDISKSAVKQLLEKTETLKKTLMQEYFG